MRDKLNSPYDVEYMSRARQLLSECSSAFRVAASNVSAREWLSEGAFSDQETSDHHGPEGVLSDLAPSVDDSRKMGIRSAFWRIFT